MSIHKEIAISWKSSLKPPDTRPVWEWGEENIVLPGSITEAGAFDASLSNYFKEPLEALQDDKVRIVNLRWPTRAGKSLVGQIFMVWAVVNDIGPMLYVMQSGDVADDIADTRIMPMLLGCVVAKDKLSSNRYDTKKSEIKFADGTPLWVRGMIKSEMQSKSVRYLFMDEPYFCDQSLIYDALNRQGDWIKAGSDKLIVMCQGSDLGDWTDENFKGGSQSLLHFKCLRCGELHPAKLWSPPEESERWGLVWDTYKDELDRYVYDKILPTVRYKCKFCGHLHEDTPATKRLWNETYTYIDDNPNAPSTHKSYTLSAIVTLPWANIVQDWLEARRKAKAGNLEPLSKFIQKKAAEPWDPDYLLNIVRNSTVDYDPEKEWEDEDVRVAGVDVQSNDLFYVVIRAWASDGRSRRLYFNRIYGWDTLAKVLNDEWKVRSSHVFVDAGYNKVNVLRFCSRYGYTACTGENQDKWYHSLGKGKKKKQVQRCYSPPVIADSQLGTAQQGKGKRTYLFQFSDSILSDTLMDLMRSPGGLFACPVDSDREMEKIYLKQIGTMEKKLVVVKTKLGNTDGKNMAIKGKKWQWVARSKDNHFFDCEKITVLVAMILKKLPDPLEVGSE